MNAIEALVLGIIQGVTEFLPVSSSGHLIIFEELFGLNIAKLRAFDVTVHLGTLTAVIAYFRKDIWGIVKGFFSVDRSAEGRSNRKLGWYIVLGSVPAAIAGFALNDVFDTIFRGLTVVGASMIAAGFIFFASEKWPRAKNKTHVTAITAVITGIFQAIAIIPGVSRSGSTIAAGLFQKLERTAAARFSFILGSPAMLGAALVTFQDCDSAAAADCLNGTPVMTLALGFLAAAFTGFLTIKLLMRFLKNHTLNGFGIYLIIVGTLLLLR